MRLPERCVNVAPFPSRIPKAAGRLAACCAAAAMLSACAPRSCANPYVLDFLDQADAQSDLAHVGLVRDAVVTVPGPTPDTLGCSIWERVRQPGSGPNGATRGGPVVLRPQYFRLRHVGDGWELAS